MARLLWVRHAAGRASTSHLSHTSKRETRRCRLLSAAQRPGQHHPHPRPGLQAPPVRTEGRSEMPDPGAVPGCPQPWWRGTSSSPRSPGCHPHWTEAMAAGPDCGDTASHPPAVTRTLAPQALGPLSHRQGTPVCGWLEALPLAPLSSAPAASCHLFLRVHASTPPLTLCSIAPPVPGCALSFPVPPAQCLRHLQFMVHMGQEWRQAKGSLSGPSAHASPWMGSTGPRLGLWSAVASPRPWPHPVSLCTELHGHRDKFCPPLRAPELALALICCDLQQVTQPCSWLEAVSCASPSLFTAWEPMGSTCWRGCGGWGWGEAQAESCYLMPHWVNPPLPSLSLSVLCCRMGP